MRPVPGNRFRTIAALGLLIGACIAGPALSGGFNLADELEELYFSLDLDARLAGPVGSVVIADSVVAKLDPATDLYAGIRSLQAGSSLPLPFDINAFDLALDAYSIDITETVDLIAGELETLRPGEVWTSDGTLLFDPAAAGLPDFINVDAVARDPVTGDLLLSFDTFILVDLPFRRGLVPFIAPGHVVRWDGSFLNSYFDDSRIPRELNLDAFHVLDGGRMLMSFDTPGRIEGLGFVDDDVLVYSPILDTFELAFLFGGLDPTIAKADVDALSGLRRIDGGVLSFENSLFEIPEDFGTATLDVRREGVAEGPTTVRIRTVADSASAGADFTAIDVTRSWAGGETTPKSVDIPIVNDAIGEPVEQFSVTLEVVDGAATIGAPGSVSIRIFDDETVLFADGFEDRP